MHGATESIVFYQYQASMCAGRSQDVSIEPKISTCLLSRHERTGRSRHGVISDRVPTMQLPLHRRRLSIGTRAEPTSSGRSRRAINSPSINTCQCVGSGFTFRSLALARRSGSGAGIAANTRTR
jgi:hypothetical protein